MVNWCVEIHEISVVATQLASSLSCYSTRCCVFFERPLRRHFLSKVEAHLSCHLAKWCITENHFSQRDITHSIVYAVYIHLFARLQSAWQGLLHVTTFLNEKAYEIAVNFCERTFQQSRLDRRFTQQNVVISAKIFEPIKTYLCTLVR